MTDIGVSNQASGDDIAIEIEDPGPENYDPTSTFPSSSIP